MKWQPVMLVVRERVECDCGNAAVFILIDDEAADPDDRDYSAWCQSCWEREQGAIEEGLSS